MSLKCWHVELSGRLFDTLLSLRHGMHATKRNTLLGDDFGGQHTLDTAAADLYKTPGNHELRALPVAAGTEPVSVLTTTKTPTLYSSFLQIKLQTKASQHTHPRRRRETPESRRL